eukprot:TRINITY_DN11857_c0_g1::TRINITY_DN11857_c0_g1_i1::g.16460::m.16460 TRINITY_DN11857_c0_g1::TRINITY_DN11857_c0_g1_i1::g.16460  ORF type:complete len:119 (-),score=0.53 TRINITY_DN11857_c0_g1_i1:578-934(-)
MRHAWDDFQARVEATSRKIQTLLSNGADRELPGQEEPSRCPMSAEARARTVEYRINQLQQEQAETLAGMAQVAQRLADLEQHYYQRVLVAAEQTATRCKCTNRSVGDSDQPVLSLYRA